MKVSVITRHAITNYGSLLQSLATQMAVESLGHTCEIIDYIRDDESPLHLEATLLKSKPAWNSSVLKRVAYLALRQPESLAGALKFARERSKLLKLTQRYRTTAELSLNPPVADVYMTGSDQVWGPTSSGKYDPSYLLSFVPDDAAKVSYAASLGKRVPTDETETMFRALLARYDAISVREDSAVQQLNTWGFQARQVLDPTLLMTGDDWRRFAGGEKTRLPYVLIYQIHSNPRVGRYAEVAAKKLGLPLVRVSTHFHQVTREGKLEYLPDIRKFIRLIDGARLLVTDSFHGIAFAINLNTSFVQILPDNGTETRNTSILRLTGLEGRVLKGNDLLLAGKSIDYTRVNTLLSLEREHSINVMRSLIEGGRQ